MENNGFDCEKSVVTRNESCESYDNECNEYRSSDLKHYCDIPSAVQNGIADRFNGDIISVTNSSNIQIGAKIGRVIVDNFTVVSSVQENKIDPRKRKIIIGFVSSLCFLLAIACIVYFVFLREGEVEWIVKRKAWGARDAKKPCETDGQQVIEAVLFQTGTKFCNNVDECSDIVRKIQSTDLTDVASTDIKYNFLIGGDGNAYEGLDWSCKGEHVFLPFSAMHIGIIGNYSKSDHNDVLNPKQIEVLQKLFEYGIRKQKLYDKFGISPACCYKNISDPGDSVLREMVNMPQYIRACLHTSNCDYSNVPNMDAVMNYKNKTDL